MGGGGLYPIHHKLASHVYLRVADRAWVGRALHLVAVLHFFLSLYTYSLVAF